jgi:hypothetical protein
MAGQGLVMTDTWDQRSNTCIAPTTYNQSINHCMATTRHRPVVLRYNLHVTWMVGCRLSFSRLHSSTVAALPLRHMGTVRPGVAPL